MSIKPCDQDVFDNGQSVCLVDIPKETAENICRSLSAATGCKVDWHYVGGRVHIKALAAPVVERQPEGKRERFEKWVMATKHPVFGFLDGRSLARGDDRTGYADEYVQGLWVAYKKFTAPPELAELQATIARLEAQLHPRTVRDVVSFAYIEKMSVRQISDLLTSQHVEITMLRNVVKEVAEQFDGGPDHPWIPGFNAKKIYNKVMMASVPLCSAQSDDSPE
jgi:hypothetical protein